MKTILMAILLVFTVSGAKESDIFGADGSYKDEVVN